LILKTAEGDLSEVWYLISFIKKDGYWKKEIESNG